MSCYLESLTDFADSGWSFCVPGHQCDALHPPQLGVYSSLFRVNGAIERVGLKNGYVLVHDELKLHLYFEDPSFFLVAREI